MYDNKKFDYTWLVTLKHHNDTHYHTSIQSFDINLNSDYKTMNLISYLRVAEFLLPF